MDKLRTAIEMLELFGAFIAGYTAAMIVMAAL